MTKFIDLTHTIIHKMEVFPGEKRPSLIRDDLPEDAGYITYRLESNMHTGTHIDAPFHVISDTITIDKFPLELFSLSATVIDVRGLVKIHMKTGWEQIFSNFKAVLFYTGHSDKWGTDSYYSDYPEFDAEIAESLVAAGVKIAGFDSPSPDKSPYAFHSIFLKDERFLIENLASLEAIAGKENLTFIAFPLKIEAEASLIRAVATFDEK
jgi:kynurenine formamidase